MQVNYALILSAGFGTRMGEIGKKLPKVMWPIFDKKLIDLQISYCRDLGINKIFINTHYLGDIILKYIHENYGNDVVVLSEDPLLDSGGAVHNMANHPTVNYSGNVLLVNGDQFLFFDKKYIGEALKLLKKNRAVLYGIKVDKNATYNETKIIDGKLVAIEQPSKQSNFITYSGLGILKLNELNKVAGISKFFDTVVNYKHEEVQMLTPDSEYWDFGTAEIYFKNVINLTNPKYEKSRMRSFLSKHHCLNGIQENFINTKLNSIDLNSSGKFKENAMVFGEITQLVN